MKEEQFLDYLNNADDVFVMEAMSDASFAISRTKHRGRLKAAIIAACIILAAGATIYASGIITNSLTVVKNGEEGPSGTSRAFDEKGNEIDGYSIQTQSNSNDPAEIKGQLKTDAVEQIKQDGKMYGYTSIDKNFDSFQDVVDYYGCDLFGIPYLPFDPPNIYTHALCMILPGGELSHCSGYTQSEGESDGIHISTIEQFNFDKDGKPVNISFSGASADPESYGFVTEKGIDCIVEYIEMEKIQFNGFLTKNNIVHQISIRCEKEYKEKALQILHNWAEHF